MYSPDAETLIRYLDAEIAVMVWLSVRNETGWYEWDADGNAHRLVPFEHVLVVNGYDDEGVHISDPGPGTYGFLDWNYFLSTWALKDSMMLSV